MCQIEARVIGDTVENIPQFYLALAIESLTLLPPVFPFVEKFNDTAVFKKVFRSIDMDCRTTGRRPLAHLVGDVKVIPCR